MTLSLSATESPGPIRFDAGYQPGVCNIGTEEIARRRRSGHVGTAATAALLVALVAIDAPPITRLAVAIPATIAASGYIQARLKFCAGFGSQGVFNFGAVGPVEAVTDTDAQARDRARARQIGFAGLGIGVAVGVVAALLPV